jgi:hypothetical protein
VTVWVPCPLSRKGFTLTAQPPPGPPQQPGWGPPPPQQPKPSTPILKRPGCVISLAFAGLLVLLIVIAALAGDPAPDTAAPTPTAEQPAAATTAPATAPEAPAGPAPIGREVRDGKFSFKVTRVRRGLASVGSQYVGSRAQGVFTIITLTVKNIGTESQTFDAGNQKAFAGTTAFEADTEASLYANEHTSSFLEPINPGNSITVRVVFDAPKTQKLTRLELHDSAFSGGVDASI